jgi:hypothetical protein
MRFGGGGGGIRLVWLSRLVSACEGDILGIYYSNLGLSENIERTEIQHYEHLERTEEGVIEKKNE